MLRSGVAVIAVLVFALVVASSAGAAWKIEESDGGTTFISNGKLKSSWENGSIIIEGKNKMVHFIDDNRKMIASGTIDEFCGGMKKAVDAMMENVPPEQREMMKQMLAAKKPPKVKIVKKGKGEKVSGLSTTIYEVVADGKHYESVWITNEAGIVNECQDVMKALGNLMQCLGVINSMGSDPEPEASPEYARIFQLGVIVKSVGSDEKATEMKLEKSDLADTDFGMPAGYKAVSFAVMFGMSQ